MYRVNFLDSSAVARTEVEERLGSGGSKRTSVQDGEERVSSGGSKRSGVREERASSGGTKRTSSAGSTGRGGKTVTISCSNKHITNLFEAVILDYSADDKFMIFF